MIRAAVAFLLLATTAATATVTAPGTARAQERGIEDVGTVGGSNDDDAVVGIKAVHLNKQRIERLFTFVVAAAQTVTTAAADGVDFVDKHEAGSVLAGLFEHVADTAGADTDEHFDEIRTRDGEEPVSYTHLTLPTN